MQRNICISARCYHAGRKCLPCTVDSSHTAMLYGDCMLSKRALLSITGSSLAAIVVAQPSKADDQLSKYTPMDALKGKNYGKPRMRYNDFELTDSGLQYKDLKPGNGEVPQPGDKVVIDWSGYTIGYYGRPFEARNKAKGSAFTGENKDFYRFTVGEGQVIPAFEEAIATMRPGGIRRIVVPEELGYPGNNYNSKGPSPNTFSGQRALDFVLNNQGMIDKTLLFDIELVRIEH